GELEDACALPDPALLAAFLQTPWAVTILRILVTNTHERTQEYTILSILASRVNAVQQNKSQGQRGAARAVLGWQHVGPFKSAEKLVASLPSAPRKKGTGLASGP